MTVDQLVNIMLGTAALIIVAPVFVAIVYVVRQMIRTLTREFKRDDRRAP